MGCRFLLSKLIVICNLATTKLREKISLSHKTKGHFINKYFEKNYLRYMAASLLEKPIEYPKDGPNRSTLLRNELGIDTCKDLLCHFPIVMLIALVFTILLNFQRCRLMCS